MDGVLIDSEPLWVEAVVETFNEAGIPVSKDITHQTMGMRVNESIRYWMRRFPGKSRISAAELEDKLTERVIRLIRQKGEPAAGAKEIIEVLTDNGYPLALASSSAMKIIDAVLETIALRPYFRVIRSAAVDAYGKPHPAVYLKTAEELGVEPEECLAVEDSINGVISVKAARMKCLAIPNSLIAGDPRYCLADIVLSSLKEFRLEFLQKQER